MIKGYRMSESKKTVIVYDSGELKRYRTVIIDNLNEGIQILKHLMESKDTLAFFKNIKFEKTVLEPLTGEPENLLEVINQCQTYLVSIMAVEYLFEVYPDTQFKVHFGNMSGYDIESVDGRIIAECFAATSYRSNGKLSEDLKRLSDNETAVHKYEFFFDMEFQDRHKRYYQTKYPNIEIIKFADIK